MRDVDDYLASADVVGGLLRSGEVARAWDRPSALEHWTVGGLAGHLGRSAFLVPEILAAPVPDGVPLSSAVDYFTTGLSDADLDVMSEKARAIRERGVETAGTGPGDLVERYEQTLDQLRSTLPGVETDRVVGSLGMRLTLSDYLATRLVEFAVHLDDLAASVGCDTPDLPESAQERVVGVLAGVATRRHGFTGVVRGLARVERAPGGISAF
jgi:uncharacterized protein (TIGR03083 family)